MHRTKNTVVTDRIRLKIIYWKLWKILLGQFDQFKLHHVGNSLDEPHLELRLRLRFLNIFPEINLLN